VTVVARPPTTTPAPPTGPVELTADPSFARRIKRLIYVSFFALFALWGLATETTEGAALWLLFGAWLLMPGVLAASLRWPRLRYLLTVPAVMAGSGLLVICLDALPDDALGRTGWILATAGVWFGAALGSWLWYRWLPVPKLLDAPFSKARWVLVAIHIALIVAGGGLVAAGLLA
jgi:hypothetical protein